MTSLKNDKRFSFSLLFLATFLISSASFAAEQAAKPTVAPFKTDSAAPQNASPLMDMYDAERAQDVVPMDKPNRTTEQIGTWVEEHVTDVMNIDVMAWDDHLKKIVTYFDPYGFQEYQNYLKTSGVLDLLKTNRLRLNAIENGNVTLLSEGALNGSYHWLYQMPLMLTYYDQDTKTLKTGKVKSQNQKVIVRVQLGRVAKGADDNNVVIERWSVVPAN